MISDVEDRCYFLAELHKAFTSAEKSHDYDRS